MKRNSLSWAAVAGLLLAATAGAQEWERQEDASGIRANVGGSTIFPIGDLASRFNQGWGFNLGLGYQFTPLLEAHAEYLFSAHGVDSTVLEGLELDGDHWVHGLNLSAKANFVSQSGLKLYAIGGPGMYYRRVTVSEVIGTAVVPYCDPWLYFCTTTVAPIESILGSRDSWDFGLQGGLGISYHLGYVAIYAEARYHYIFGPEVRDAVGETRRANGMYLPLTLGLRF